MNSFKQKIVIDIQRVLAAGNAGPEKPLIGLALSGGVDSMALLDILSSKELQPFYQRLFAFHFNHGLRGEAADADEIFLQNYCSQKEVSYFSEKIDVLKYSIDNAKTIEEAARDLRYDRLTHFKESYGLAYIFLAHHADDKAETVFFNLLRGCGLHGAAALQKQNGFYLRPFLAYSKSVIESYAEINRLVFREDHTNRENDYSRNKIRNLLIPGIEKTLNRNVRSALNRFSAIAAEADDYINQQAALLLRQSEDILVDNKMTLVRRELICSLHSCVAKQLIYQVVRNFGNHYRWNYQTAERLFAKVLQNRDFTETVNGLKIIQWHDYICFSTIENANITQHDLCLNHDYSAGLYSLRLSDSPLDDYTALLSGDSIKGQICLAELDFNADFYPFGSQRPVAVRKVLSDKKIPLFLRDSLLMLTDSEKVLYITGAGSDNRTRITGRDKSKVYLSLTGRILDFIGRKRIYERK